jgi:hypothetical protein
VAKFPGFKPGVGKLYNTQDFIIFIIIIIIIIIMD